MSESAARAARGEVEVVAATERAASAPAPARRGADWRETLRAAPPWSGVGLVLLLMVVALSATQELFLTSLNLQNVFEGLALSLTLAVGTTFLIALGVVDLSIGAILALSSVALANVMADGVPVPLMVLAVIAAGAGLGACNGVLTAKLGLSFFVVTLGTLSAFASIAKLLTDQGLAVQLVGRPGFDSVQWFGNGKVAGVSAPGLIAVGAVLAALAAYRYTTFGRAISAIGGNENAARLAGIPVERVKVAVWALNGALVGLAAIIASGRSSSADPSFGPGVELTVIAAVLLGGSSFAGGSISFVGTLFGVVFIAVLQNGLTLFGVATFWQGVVTGAVLILAVGLDRLRGNRS
jgi:ribose/xylose/arabinose/galactoside ABC-type transport system permease subunit